MSRAVVVAAACVGLAGLSLLLPWDLSFDPWGWVLWGRELTGAIPFSTALYPSWKPLPVIFTTVFSPFGAAAPQLWLLVARTGALAAVVLAYRVGARLGGRVAGVAAAAGLVLLPESLRFFAAGASEPLLIALVLGAIDRHLDDRRGQALALAFCAGLLRPEVWPFLLAYAAVYAWRRPRRVAIVAALAVALSALWFVPEWAGAGDPFYGSWLARVSREAEATQRLASPELEALRRSFELVLPPLGIAAIVAVVVAAYRRQVVPLALGAGALAWIGIVVAMTAQGYAGLGRFSLPAGAVICLLGGLGIAGLVDRARGGGRWLAIAVALLVCVPFTVPRIDRMSTSASAATARDKLEDQLPAVIDRVGGTRRVLACRRVVVDEPMVPAAAWHLRVPIERLAKVKRPRLVFLIDNRELRRFGGSGNLHRPAPVRPTVRVARVGGWEVIASRKPRPCVTARAGG